MACRLTGAKPLSELMLEICWLEAMNKLQWNFNGNSYIFIQEHPIENVIWKMAAILSWPQYVKPWQQEMVFIVNFMVSPG